nr:MAG TPA: hypothetical protein [Caudoviricetes sp.]
MCSIHIYLPPNFILILLIFNYHYVIFTRNST